MRQTKLLFFLLFCFIIANADAQVRFNGKAAAVDTLTGNWLL